MEKVTVRFFKPSGKWYTDRHHDTAQPVYNMREKGNEIRDLYKSLFEEGMSATFTSESYEVPHLVR